MLIKLGNQLSYCFGDFLTYSIKCYSNVTNLIYFKALNNIYIILLFILLPALSCKKQESFFEQVTIDSPYWFSTQIRDSFTQNIISYQSCATKSCDIGDHQNALKYWDQNLDEHNFQSNQLNVEGDNLVDSKSLF